MDRVGTQTHGLPGVATYNRKSSFTDASSLSSVPGISD